MNEVQMMDQDNGTLDNSALRQDINDLHYA